MQDHKIDLIKTDKETKITCSCGNFSSSATEERFVKPIVQRHLMHNRIWPYKDHKKPEEGGWK